MHFRIRGDLSELETANVEKSRCVERLLRVLSAFVDMKNRIHNIRKTVADLQKRSERVRCGISFDKIGLIIPGY